MILIKKLKRKLRRVRKFINLELIINKRIFLCRIIYSDDYVNCFRCKYTQRCYGRCLRINKWIV
jgi:hypothetical protein